MYPAVDALRRRPGRSALAALGIGLATALVVILLAISAGIQASASTLATESGVDLLGTGIGTDLLSEGAPAAIDGSHALASEIPRADPNVESASPWLVTDLVFGNATLWSDANETANGSSVPSSWSPASSGAVGWIPSDNAGIEVPPIYAGAGFSSPGDPHYANGSYNGPSTGEVVLDQGLATVLGVVPGDLVWASAQSPSGPAELEGWYRAATAFRVVGVSGPFWLIPSAFLGFFYLSELQQLSGGSNLTSDESTLVLMHLYDDADPSRDASVVEAAFPTLNVLTLAQILGLVAKAVSLYRTFGDIVGAIGLVVAALFTTTVLLMSVDDRSREIAVRRAIGFSGAAIGRSVVEESVLLSLFGLAAGLPMAAVGTIALNAFLVRAVGDLPSGFEFVSFDLGVIGAGVLIVLAIALAASIAPVARALRLPIAEELRAP